MKGARRWAGSAEAVNVMGPNGRSRRECVSPLRSCSSARASREVGRARSFLALYREIITGPAKGRWLNVTWREPVKGNDTNDSAPELIGVIIIDLKLA